MAAAGPVCSGQGRPVSGRSVADLRHEDDTLFHEWLPPDMSETDSSRMADSGLSSICCFTDDVGFVLVLEAVEQARFHDATQGLQVS